MPLGALVAGAFGLGGQQRAYDLQRNMYRNRYQWTKYDLEKAGFNPMLAIGSAQPAPSAGTSNLGAAVAAGSQAGTAEKTGKIQRGVYRGQVELLDSQRQKTNEEAETEQYKRAHLRAGATEAMMRTDLLSKDLPAASAAATLHKTSPWVKWLQLLLGAGRGIGKQ